MSSMQRLSLAAASGIAASSLETANNEFKRDVVHIISMMRRILGAPIPSPPPRLPSEECRGCHARGDLYCQNCTTRLQKHHEKLFLKKAANLLMGQHKTELLTKLEANGTIDNYQKWTQANTELSLQREKLAETKAKIEAVRLAIAAKEAALLEREQATQKLREKNLQFEKHLEQRRDTIQQLEKAGDQARRAREDKEAQLASLRRAKVRHLLSIMPIAADPTRPGRTIFMNTALRDDGIFETSVPVLREDPEITAVALGNLVHLLKILGKYLNVTYPFQMRFNGSQSLIWLGGSEYATSRPAASTSCRSPIFIFSERDIFFLKHERRRGTTTKLP